MTYLYIYALIYTCIYCMILTSYMYFNTTWKQEAFFENDTHGDIPLKI